MCITSEWIEKFNSEMLPEVYLEVCGRMEFPKLHLSQQPDSFKNNGIIPCFVNHIYDSCFSFLKDEKNQVLTTNIWLQMVSWSSGGPHPCIFLLLLPRFLWSNCREAEVPWEKLGLSSLMPHMTTVKQNALPLDVSHCILQSSAYACILPQSDRRKF